MNGWDKSQLGAGRWSVSVHHWQKAAKEKRDHATTLLWFFQYLGLPLGIWVKCCVLVCMEESSEIDTKENLHLMGQPPISESQAQRHAACNPSLAASQQNSALKFVQIDKAALYFDHVNDMPQIWTPLSFAHKLGHGDLNTCMDTPVNETLSSKTNIERWCSRQLTHHSENYSVNQVILKIIQVMAPDRIHYGKIHRRRPNDWTRCWTWETEERKREAGLGLLVWFKVTPRDWRHTHQKRKLSPYGIPIKQRVSIKVANKVLIRIPFPPWETSRKALSEGENPLAANGEPAAILEIGKVQRVRRSAGTDSRTKHTGPE